MGDNNTGILLFQVNSGREKEVTKKKKPTGKRGINHLISVRKDER